MEQMTNDTPYRKERPSAHDNISRQAAIDAADRTDYTGLAIEDVKKVTDEVVKELKRLPSAQPEIIHCESCEHWKNEHLCECLSRYGTFETPKNFYCGYGKEK